jgi:hypothetical protein
MPGFHVQQRFRQWWVRRGRGWWLGERDQLPDEHADGLAIIQRHLQQYRDAHRQPERDRYESDDGHRVASIFGVLSGREQLEVPQFFAFDCDWRERYRHGWAGDREQRQPDDQREHRSAPRR